jgi:hypothetical protein
MAAAIAFVVIALFALSMFFWPTLFRWDRDRRRRRDPDYVPPRVMGVFDEVFHPDAHAASQIQEAEHVIPAPAPLPGDPSNKRRRAV